MAPLPSVVIFLVLAWTATVIPLRWLRIGAVLQVLVGVVAAMFILNRGAAFFAIPPMLGGLILWLSWWVSIGIWNGENRGSEVMAISDVQV